MPYVTCPCAHGLAPPTTSKVFGKVVKGCFVTVGRAGVFDVEEYDDRSMKENTLEHDASGPLAAQGLARRREALDEAFAQASRARDASAVTVEAVTLSAVMDLLGESQIGPKETQQVRATARRGSEGSKSTDGEEEEESASDVDSTSSIEMSVPLAAKARTSFSFATPTDKKSQETCKGTLKISGAKGKRKATVPCGQRMQGKSVESSGQGSSKPATSPSSICFKRQDAEGPLHMKTHVAAIGEVALASAPTAMLDGRALRMKKNQEKIIWDMRRKLCEQCQFNENIVPRTTIAQKAWRVACATRGKECGSILSQAKTALKRIEVSPNKESYANEVKELEDMIDTVGLMQSLNAQLLSASPSPSEFLMTVEAVAATGLVELGPLVWARAFGFRFAECIVSQTYLTLPDLLSHSNPEVVGSTDGGRLRVPQGEGQGKGDGAREGWGGRRRRGGRGGTGKGEARVCCREGKEKGGEGRRGMRTGGGGRRGR